MYRISDILPQPYLGQVVEVVLFVDPSACVSLTIRLVYDITCGHVDAVVEFTFE